MLETVTDGSAEPSKRFNGDREDLPPVGFLFLFFRLTRSDTTLAGGLKVVDRQGATDAHIDKNSLRRAWPVGHNVEYGLGVSIGLALLCPAMEFQKNALILNLSARLTEDRHDRIGSMSMRARSASPNVALEQMEDVK